MREFVLYHNPERMGYLADEVSPFRIATDRNHADIIDRRVWMITGEGEPRTFKLIGHFIAAEQHEEIDGDFRWTITAPRSTGVELRRARWPVLNNEPWWKDFLFRQGNFGFGLNPISDKAHLDGLLAVMARVQKYDPPRTGS